MQQQPLFPNLPEPKTQLQVVLLMLIQAADGVSERDTHYNGFRSRISNLKLDYAAPIKTVSVKFITDLKKKSHYNRHYIEASDKQTAIALYHKLVLASTAAKKETQDFQPINNNQNATHAA